jgi:hypothetical protein
MRYVTPNSWLEDGRLWGTSFEAVPSDQLGVTDVVSEYMSCFGAPTFASQFTKPAIVPIPEPPAWALVLLGAVAHLAFRGGRCHRCPDPASHTQLLVQGSPALIQA